MMLTLGLGLGDRVNSIVLQETGGTLETELDVALGTEGRVCGDSNAVGLAEVDQPLLGQVGVELDLVNLGRNASITKNVKKDGSSGVARKQS